MPDDRVVTLDASDPQIHNLDLGYAQNSHKVQGASADRVIAAADGENRLLATLRAAYVNLTRPINELELYTGDAGKLEDTIARSNSDKVAAVEVAGEYPFAEAIRADESRDGNVGIGERDHADPVARDKHGDAIETDADFQRLSRMTIIDDFRDYFAPGTDPAREIAHALDAVPDFAATLLENFAADAPRLNPDHDAPREVPETPKVPATSPELASEELGIDDKAPEIEISRDFGIE